MSLLHIQKERNNGAGAGQKNGVRDVVRADIWGGWTGIRGSNSVTNAYSAARNSVRMLHIQLHWIWHIVFVRYVWGRGI